MNNPLQNLIRRLDKIGISLELIGNAPWIYLRSINGKAVTEHFLGNHGFTIAWYPVKPGETVTLTDIREIFKTIRKYR